MCEQHGWAPAMCDLHQCMKGIDMRISLQSASTGVSNVTGRPPRVIYMIPSGQNPTGAVMSTERKAEIYEVGPSVLTKTCNKMVVWFVLDFLQTKTELVRLVA